MEMDAHSRDHPFVVVEGRDGPAGARAAALLERALNAARDGGWSVIRGWAAPMRRDRIVCTGWIRTPDDARRALLAAVSGARLAVGISTDRVTVDQFLDDLRRLGQVEHVPEPGGPDRGPRIAAPDARQRALLGLLSEGLTVLEAANELGMSRRMAERRLR
jgi:hypothetical protein